MNVILRFALLVLGAGLICPPATVAGGSNPPEGWAMLAPRDEIRPAFSYDAQGGPKQTGSFVISHDQREGLDGWFQKSFTVTRGEFYRFSALRKTRDVAIPRHSGLARIVWQDEAGKIVRAEPPSGQANSIHGLPSAEPEHPLDGAVDAQGWTTVAGVYRAPARAVRAIVELHLQHAPNGQAEWSEVDFSKTTAPASRQVRLATVHYRPTGRSTTKNCEEFAPMVAEAAKQKADLVVLGETVPYVGVKQPLAELAEKIPGPTTEYFGELAAQHHLHIALSLYERDGHLIYNTAVLLGPDGKLIGKYRKVCLPHGEVEKGVTPGRDYPVFETALGKIGMMVCYDGFFPEVARELTNRGAEIIAWPVWGCDPLLARARACENRVYLVSSTYTDSASDWMISAVYDPAGTPIAQASQWGTVAVAEVDLSRPYVGPYNLGDFHSMVTRHRPPSATEAIAAEAAAH